MPDYSHTADEGLPSGLNLLDPDTFTGGCPYDLLAELSVGPPVRHSDSNDGFWVVTRYEDVVKVSRHPEIFSSHERGTILHSTSASTPEEEEASLGAQRMMMLNQDPPQHTKLRSLVQRVFTPKRVAALEPRLRELTVEIIDAALAKGEGDFVEDVAAELPLLAIAELMGVPIEDRRKIFDWSNKMIGSEDPEFNVTPEDTQMAAAEMYMYAAGMAEARRECPVGDIMSNLVHAEVDGHKLSETEFEMFFVLLAVAGNETTRNAIAHGMHAFFQHPDQWELLKSDPSLIDTAVEEIVRWATPVMVFQRTALCDTELGGAQIKAGDRVAIYYSSANRQDDVFDDPFRFDITRQPNEHIAFGGGGPHFCLGANLARLEMKLMFEELATRMPDIQPAGDVRLLRSSFIDGIKALPVRYLGPDDSAEGLSVEDTEPAMSAAEA